MEEKLKIREALKSRKPRFLYQDHHKKARLPKSWRKPRGLQSKMRLKKKGYPGSPSCGYRSPVLVRCLNPQGLKEVIVYNVKDLDKIDLKTEVAVLASSVGTRKKVQIVTVAAEKKISIANLKNPKRFLQEVKKASEERKLQKTKSQKEKEKKQKDLKEAAEKKQDLVSKIEAEEEQKDKQKKDFDKLLTKKE